VIREVAKEDSRVTVLEGGENRGLPAANNAIRNHILNEVDCDYIAWLAADDWWRMDKIESQIDHIHTRNVDISYTDTVFVTPDNRAQISSAPEFDFNLLCQINFINGSSILWKRIVVETLAGGIYIRKTDGNLYGKSAARGEPIDEQGEGGILSREGMPGPQPADRDCCPEDDTDRRPFYDPWDNAGVDGSKGEVMSIWIPADLKEELDRYCDTFAERSRSRWVCSAIRRFLNDMNRRG